MRRLPWSAAQSPRKRGRSIFILGTLLILSAAANALNYYRAGIPRYARPALPTLNLREPSRPAAGPLSVHRANGRYFTDGSEKAVLLAGAHTWSSFQDNGYGDPPPLFDYDGYLAFLAANHHSFFRLWCWEQSRWAPWVPGDDYYFHPGPPYQRTGPGAALDGKLRFNLDLLDDVYFERLRSRVARAGAQGIYVSIMLFNGWSIDNEHGHLHLGNPWHGHPFNRSNNANDVDGDPNRNDGGEETHQLVVPRVTGYQDAYVRRVIDEVNEFGNVLFEISNESYTTSRDWQYHMIDLIHEYEAGKPKQHPVGMSQYQWPGNNADLWEGPAAWVAPWEELPQYPYRDDPRPADGRKVVIVDTDHLWGIGGDRKWVWKTFLRGNQPSFMDPYDGSSVGCGAPPSWDVRRATWGDILRDILHVSSRPAGWNPDAERWVSLRVNLGYVVDFSERVDLAKMVPRSALSSTGYCLAHAGGASTEFLVYVEDSATPAEVDLSEFPRELAQEWFDPNSGRTVSGADVPGGAIRRFRSPFPGDAVLYLHRRETPPVPGRTSGSTWRPTASDGRHIAPSGDRR